MAKGDYSHLDPQQGGGGAYSRKAGDQIAHCAMRLFATVATALMLSCCGLLCMVSGRERVRIYYFLNQEQS